MPAPASGRESSFPSFCTSASPRWRWSRRCNARSRRSRCPRRPMRWSLRRERRSGRPSRSPSPRRSRRSRCQTLWPRRSRHRRPCRPLRWSSRPFRRRPSRRSKRRRRRHPSRRRREPPRQTRRSRKTFPARRQFRPAPPQREAALTAPPRPARPPPPERLPGLYLPDLRFAPLPPRPEPPRRGLDLSPGSRQQLGRDSPEAQLSVRGAKVGPDWRNAFRRWLDDHGRYPPNAALVGEQGTTRIELIVEPDGRVRSGRLLRRSGSVWLDAGTVSLFRNAVLPPFPPGADPDGVTVDLTINYVLIR